MKRVTSYLRIIILKQQVRVEMIYHNYFYTVTILKLYKYFLEDEVQTLIIYISNKTDNNLIELIFEGKLDCLILGLKYE